MKKGIIFFILIFTICLSGCAEKNSEFLPEATDDNITAALPDKKADRADEILQEMSLEEKVGQLFIVVPECFDDSGSDTTMFSSDMTEKLNKYNVGGIILFAKNIVDPEQTKKLIDGFQENSKYPLFTAVDEEGGRVARVANNDSMGVEKTEAMADVADIERANDIGKSIGKYLSKLGFNLDFAPVADVLTDKNNTEIGDRSFGSDAEKCGELSAEVVKGLQDKGVSACLKHFPGHGGSEANSHEGFSQSDRTLDEMRSTEFAAFKKGIEAGSDFVMVAHIAVPKLTGDTVPADLSEYVVTELLKGELGYKGLVISDALNMGAISEYYGSDAAAVRAFKAGIDVLLMPENLDSAYNAVLNAVKSGEISEERLNESVKKIIDIKLKRGIMK